MPSRTACASAYHIGRIHFGSQLGRREYNDFDPVGLVQHVNGHHHFVPHTKMGQIMNLRDFRLDELEKRAPTCPREDTAYDEPLHNYASRRATTLSKGLTDTLIE